MTETAPIQTSSALPAVILAGGKATRMGGRDKALAPYQGQSLIQAVITRIAPQVDALAINANGDAARFESLGLPVLPDPCPDQPGPLAGILAGMIWAGKSGYSHVLSVPTDSPFLPHDLMERLKSALRDAPDAAVAMAASADGTAHPVIALWPTAAIPELTAFLASGEGRVRAFAQRQGLVMAAFPAATPDPFTNINHSAELDLP